jgi:septal ring factor EnvC (AmiA/AmiB activator)
MNDNISAPATKADLRELATKTELKELEQKLTGKIDAVEQKLTGKIDAVEQKLTGRIDSVETTVKSIAIELAKTQADVREIKHDMATKMATKDDISRVLSAIDTYTAEAISYRNRDTLRGGKIMEHETRLTDHENRIALLETGK